MDNRYVAAHLNNTSLSSVLSGNPCYPILKNIALLYAFFIPGMLLIVAQEVGQFILA